MSERHDVWQVADEIQQDLRNAQAKLTKLRSLIASRQPFQSLSEAKRCDECGVGGGLHTADCTILEEVA